ncbi:MAG: hypothetical protein Q9162_001867 [Coniocarpon cinnabarinum]
MIAGFVHHHLQAPDATLLSQALEDLGGRSRTVCTLSTTQSSQDRLADTAFAESAKHDKPYRRWASQIERAVAHFDTARLEWPDYISGLGRLLKAIQAHPPDTRSLPHKTLVANKLAQCLDPSLPSGVHSKALEIYDFIFTLLRRDGLAQDLGVFLPGLSPVLSFASLSIRPLFLTLLEKHVVNLDASALRPALRALLLAVLPGLEEEHSEDFDRSFKVVGRLRDTVNAGGEYPSRSVIKSGDEFFWQCLFLACISSPSRRQGILVFLARQLPKLSSAIPTDDQIDGSGPTEELSSAAEAVVSPEPGLLIRCFVAGLEDEQPLIQRGFLDLLLNHLPLHSPVLTARVRSHDLERLVTAASAVLSRRDMSLNRRLWSWFLGPEGPDEDSEVASPSTPLIAERRDTAKEEYFKRFALAPLSDSILHTVQDSHPSLTQLIKSYRTIFSLLDRSEISHSLIPKIFAPSLDSLLRFRTQSSSSSFQEALRSGSAFFDGIDAGAVWLQILQLISSAFDEQEASFEYCVAKLDLVCFIIGHFNVHDEEMLAFHIPLCCVFTLSKVLQRAAISRENQSDSVIQKRAVHVSELLVEQMPERVHLNASFRQDADIGHLGKDDDTTSKVTSSIMRFYTEHDGDLSSSPPPFSSQQIADLLTQSSQQICLEAFVDNSAIPSVAAKAKLFSDILLKTPECHALNIRSLADRSRAALLSGHSHQECFVLASSVSRIYFAAMSKASDDQKSDLRRSGLGLVLVQKLWQLMSPSSPKFHVESARALWQIDSADPRENILESSVSQFVSEAKPMSEDSAEPARRFAMLWTHSMNIASGAPKHGSIPRRGSLTSLVTTSIETQDHQSKLMRPLLLVLEGLEEIGSELYFFLCGWLKSSGNLLTVIDVLISKLSSLKPTPEQRAEQAVESDQHRPRFLHSDRTPESCYYLKLFLALFRLPLENMDAVLSTPGTPLADPPQESDETLHANAMRVCLDIALLGFEKSNSKHAEATSYSEMQCQALSIVQRLLSHADKLELELLTLERDLLDMLGKCTRSGLVASSVQVSTLETTKTYLRFRYALLLGRSPHHRKPSSIDGSRASLLRRSSVDRREEKDAADKLSRPPDQLLKRLQEGIASPHARNVLESWVNFLIDVLPFYAHSLFQNLIPLVESFCKQINTNLRRLRRSFVSDGDDKSVMSETSLISLLNGLESTLAIAHDQLAVEGNTSMGPKNLEAPQGLLGNVVSGVFAAETQRTRQSSANSRLTVVLCLQDAVKTCFSIWSWAAYGQNDDKFDSDCQTSFNYLSSRLRNRARRLLDQLFLVEPLECLETLLTTRDVLQTSQTVPSDFAKAISLLHNLDGSRPKRLMPALFNSLYSRTNPSALEQGRVSTMTSEVSETSLSRFLVEYTRALDDDAMDEIWTDCIAFMKDVLSNPFVHKSILQYLLLFLQTLAEKVEKTNFGEQRKMRRELSDFFQRLLQAIFASRPAGLLQDTKLASVDGSGLNIIEVFNEVIPKLHVVVSEPDKQANAVSLLSNNIFSVLVHAKQFPENVTQSHLSLLQKTMRIQSGAKIWRKDVAEFYNHPRLFSFEVTLVMSELLLILRQWALGEKERVPETLSRIPAPTAAGIMFGVGASAARLEADKKSQLHLRRVTLLVLALDDNALVPHIPSVLEKINELLHASATSSPSSATRAEVYLLLQAVLLKTSPVHLSTLWPVITGELQHAISSASAESKDHDLYNGQSLLQACKLLDMLLLIGPEDFQMHAWLFVTDTIDAVYRPSGVESATPSLVDEIAEEMSQEAPHTPGDTINTPPNLTARSVVYY